jgi:hypothetical protein
LALAFFGRGFCGGGEVREGIVGDTGVGFWGGLFDLGFFWRGFREEIIKEVHLSICHWPDARFTLRLVLFCMVVPSSLLVECCYRARCFVGESLFARHCLELRLQDEPMLLINQELIVELLEELIGVS